jgi:hypothetical protein
VREEKKKVRRERKKNVDAREGDRREKEGTRVDVAIATCVS